MQGQRRVVNNGQPILMEQILSGGNDSVPKVQHCPAESAIGYSSETYRAKSDKREKCASECRMRTCCAAAG